MELQYFHQLRIDNLNDLNKQKHTVQIIDEYGEMTVREFLLNKYKSHHL